MSTQETKLKDIADAIRAKEGSSDPIIANDFPARIMAIQTGTDTSDATATAGDILSGETAYVASGKVTGTIPTKTESNISVSGPTIIVPSGYYGSQVSKSVATVTQATPTISVNSSGLITASSTQSAGYVTSGTKSATKQLTTQGGTTITPGTAQKTAVASGRYTTGPVYVAGSSDLTAKNIKYGVNIFGVTGTYTGPSIYTNLGVNSIEVTSASKITITLPASLKIEDVIAVQLYASRPYYCGFMFAYTRGYASLLTIDNNYPGSPGTMWTPNFYYPSSVNLGGSSTGSPYLYIYIDGVGLMIETGTYNVDNFQLTYRQV